MSAQRSGTINNIYDILSSNVDPNTGVVTFSIGTASDAWHYSDNVEYWTLTGFMCLPANPPASNPTDVAQSVTVNRADQDIAFSTRDVRYQEFLSDIVPGDLYLWAQITGKGEQGGTGCGIKIKAAGTINLYAPNGINLVSPTTTSTNGGTTDFVAIASEVNTNFTSLITAINALTFGTFPVDTPLVPSAIISNMASSSLKGDK